MEENTPLQSVEQDQLQPSMSEATPADKETIAATPETDSQSEPTPATDEAAPATPEEASQPAETEAESTPDYTQLDREQLLETLEQLLNEEVQQIKGRAAALRTRFNELNREVQQKAQDAFVAEGGAKEEFTPQNDNIAERFYALYDQYRARRQKYMEDLEAQKQKNYEAKQALIDELRTLVDSEDEMVRTALDRFNDIQARWKEIGEVPRERMNDLWQSYHFQMEQFFNKLKINRELRDNDRKRNLEAKIALCERAEEMIMEPSVNKAFKELQELRTKWKEIGAVPTEQNEEIWQRFQAAAARIDERRKEEYERRKEEYDNNLLAKQALIDRATELTAELPTTTRGWNDVTAALDELLKMWKAIGPVPREVNEEVWSKFKGMIDKHYADKKEHFATVRDEQDSNYQRKIDLCLKAEAIAERDDWKQATAELLQLQKEWKEIGSVNRKQSEKVWQRFRGACDKFFARKEEFFKGRREGESENLAKKQQIISELKAHEFGSDREENLNAIKDFQRRWAEVGHVPMAEKEKLQKEFRGEINRIFEQLKISAREAEETAYRERLRNMGGEAVRFARNESTELRERIEKLRGELSLWENNLGFLASSKQADLLKQEFEKKMQNTRQQIALLQSKLRILNEESRKEETPKEENTEKAE